MNVVRFPLQADERAELDQNLGVPRADDLDMDFAEKLPLFACVRCWASYSCPLAGAERIRAPGTE